MQVTGVCAWHSTFITLSFPSAACSIIQQVLQAVAQCHAKGVMVRDVKPENFLFLDDRPNAPLKVGRCCTAVLLSHVC